MLQRRDTSSGVGIVLALEHFTAHSAPCHLCDAVYDMGVNERGSQAVWVVKVGFHDIDALSG